MFVNAKAGGLYEAGSATLTTLNQLFFQVYQKLSQKLVQLFYLLQQDGRDIGLLLIVQTEDGPYYKSLL